MFHVRPARPDEAAELYRGRHEVYVREMRAMPPRPDGQIRDRFDGRPHTLNLAVVADDGTPRKRIVGGARWVVDGGTGTTADAYFDFAPHLPPDALRGAGSMLWMLPEARGQRGLVGELMAEGLAWSIEQGVSHILATVNPPVASRFARVGYEPVGHPFLHATGLPVQPMVLATGVGEARRAA